MATGKGDGMGRGKGPKFAVCSETQFTEREIEIQTIHTRQQVICFWASESGHKVKNKARKDYTIRLAIMVIKGYCPHQPPVQACWNLIMPDASGGLADP